MHLFESFHILRSKLLDRVKPDRSAPDENYGEPALNPSKGFAYTCNDSTNCLTL